MRDMKMTDLTFCGTHQGDDYTNVSLEYKGYKVVLTFDKGDSITFNVSIWEGNRPVKEWTCKTQMDMKEEIEYFFTEKEYAGEFDKKKPRRHFKTTDVTKGVCDC